MNSTTIVATNYGLVQGVATLSLLNDVFFKFMGIPYAKPPVDALRFKVSVYNSFSFRTQTQFSSKQDPQLPHPWIGIWDATREPSSCWQKDQFTGEYLGSEDCLYLNVFTRNVSLYQ